MSAVWMRARHELRRRWRALVGLALIAGIGSGAAIAAVEGARRTVSAYPRFRASTNAFDVLIGTNGNKINAIQVIELTSAESLPEITEWSLTDAATASVTGPSGVTETFPDLFAVASPDGRIGTTLNAVRILSGRRAVPSRTDEAVLSTFEAERLGASVGSTLTLTFAKSRVAVRVVGIGIAAGTVDPAAGGYIPLLLLTPAFYEAHPADADRAGPTLAVRLRGGIAAVPKLTKDVAKINSDLNATITAGEQTAAVRRTAVFQAVGLLLFGGLALLTVLAIFTQLLARQIFLEGVEQDALRALGMSRAQLFGLSMLRVGLVAAGAAVAGVLIAVVASPLFPIGFMHQLEVSPGIRLDMVALALGAAGTILLILLAGLYPAWRSSSTQRSARTAPSRTNTAANALAAASFPPTAVAGVRLALEPGRGATAVPVRTTLIGTALALAALTASLGFGASLRRLVSTPRLSGWNFDALVISDDGRATGEKLRSLGLVSSYATGDNPDILVRGLLVNALAFEPGSFGPSIIAGRRPRGTNEIALGTKTLRKLHLSIGNTVPVSFIGGPNNEPFPAVQMRIVGTVVNPQFFFSQSAGGDSAAVSEEIIDSASIPDHPPGGAAAYVRFAPGISVGRGVERVRQSITGNLFILRRSASSDLANLQRISSLPNVLGALLAVVAAGTLAHTLISSVRRRRRDLAILRTLGFVRGQVRMTVVWQATTTVLIALAVGLPLGAIAGRWAWGLFVDQLGYVRLSIVPLIAVLLTIPAAIILSNIISSIPARAAARTQPALVLRAE